MHVSNNLFRALCRSKCKKCLTWIFPGHSIRYDSRADAYVHSDCTVFERLVSTNQQLAERSVRGIPHGLKPKTVATYTVEWERYERFVTRRGLGAVPGKHVPWDLALVAEFMEWRSRTCKPSTLARTFSILAHFGALFGFLLPNSRDDNDSLGYRRLRNIKKQLAIDHVRTSGEVLAPTRCTPLARDGLEMIFQTLGVTSRRTFERLPRRHRHNLICSVMQHSKAMRYGHFLFRSYTWQQFSSNVNDGSMSLLTDWHRYSGRSKYCLRFQAFPQQDFLWYKLKDAGGNVVDKVAAATVMQWHFDMLKRSNENQVFAPVPGKILSHADRKAWLCEVLLAALPPDEREARALIKFVTPHSFRPGLAGDMRRAGLRLEDIALECRWHGMRNARMYSERTPLTASTSSSRVRLLQY